MRILTILLIFVSIFLHADLIAELRGQNDQCMCPCPCPEKGVEKTSQGLENFPKTIVVKLLSDAYEPVEFTHEAHSLLAGSCTACHHHTRPRVYTHCVGCHPVRASTIKELAVPGLRGAYHRLCRGCHVQWENGPTGCADCHPMSKEPSSFGPPN